VKSDSRAPEMGFHFVHLVHETTASVVLYKKVNNDITPIYISDSGPLPWGQEDLLPKLKCRLWFVTKDVSTAEKSMLIEVAGFSKSQVVELSPLLTTNAVTANFTAEGTWVTAPFM
jgi:hypothetical protein